jgi:hypothetical protein
MTDLWRSAIVAAPMHEVLARGLAGMPVTWLPETRSFTFLADPFGLWRDGRLYVFVENYDYRDGLGGIDVLSYDERFALLTQQPCLRERWHLSYPVVMEAAGGTWMLPEAHRSGLLTLYRCRQFPVRWEPAARIQLDCVPVDATPLYFEGRWWLFYSPATSPHDKIARLHVAWAAHPAGPWQPHPANPVRRDPSSSRPGGTPLVIDGRVVLPMQDCRLTYGGAIRPLHVHCLTLTEFEAEAGPPLVAPPEFAPHVDGLHTLSACGAVTLLDAKRIDRSLRGQWVKVRRSWARLRRRMGPVVAPTPH